MTNEVIKYCCGPSYLPECIRKHLSKRFDLACMLHDQLYETMEINRKEVDKKFLNDMLLLSETWYDRMLAYTYYIIVRIFGWMRYGKK